jgi:hypothetical protein
MFMNSKFVDLGEFTSESLVKLAADVVGSVSMHVLNIDEVGFLRVVKQRLKMQGKFRAETATSV